MHICFTFTSLSLKKKRKREKEEEKIRPKSWGFVKINKTQL